MNSKDSQEKKTGKIVKKKQYCNRSWSSSKESWSGPTNAKRKKKLFKRGGTKGKRLVVLER